MFPISALEFRGLDIRVRCPHLEPQFIFESEVSFLRILLGRIRKSNREDHLREIENTRQLYTSYP